MTSRAPARNASWPVAPEAYDSPVAAALWRAYYTEVSDRWSVRSPRSPGPISRRRTGRRSWVRGRARGPGRYEEIEPYGERMYAEHWYGKRLTG